MKNDTPPVLGLLGLGAILAVLDLRRLREAAAVAFAHFWLFAAAHECSPRHREGDGGGAAHDVCLPWEVLGFARTVSGSEKGGVGVSLCVMENCRWMESEREWCPHDVCRDVATALFTVYFTAPRGYGPHGLLTCSERSAKPRWGAWRSRRFLRPVIPGGVSAMHRPSMRARPMRGDEPHFMVHGAPHHAPAGVEPEARSR